MNPAQHLVTWLVRLYRWTIAPAQLFLFGSGSGCRFTPSCSQYALDAVREQGALRGSLLAARRICRCHPWHPGGLDPVKPAPARPSAH